MTQFISAANQINGILQIGCALMDYEEAIEKDEALEKANSTALNILSNASSSYINLIKWQQWSEGIKNWTFEKKWELGIGLVGLVSAFAVIWNNIALAANALSTMDCSTEALKNLSAAFQTVSNFFSCAPVQNFFLAFSILGAFISSCEAFMALIKLLNLNDQIDEINKKLNSGVDPNQEAVLNKELEILKLKQNEAIKDLFIAVITIVLFIATTVASSGTASLVFAIAAAAVTLMLQIYKKGYHESNRVEGQKIEEILEQLILRECDRDPYAFPSDLVDALIIGLRETGVCNEKRLRDTLSFLEKIPKEILTAGTLEYALTM